MDDFTQSGAINESEFRLLRDYINEKCGISIPPEKAYLIETRLAKIMLDAGAETFGELHKIVSSAPDSPLHQKIINAITTNETKWFRDALPWKLMEEKLLPELVGRLREGTKNRVRIWCAAVSSGQEVYSTVMCVDDYLKKNGVIGISLADFEFFATDISSDVLEIAKKGRYDKISIMRGLDERYRDRYFTENGSAWDLDPGIRDAVRFMKFNLQDSYLHFGHFDIIFCRYVLIYFSDRSKREIAKKLSESLADNGTLFTGNYVLYDLFRDDFDTNDYGNLTYYTKKAGSE